MRGLAVGSVLAATSAEPSAKLSFRRPHRPLGSAAEIAIPAIVTLSRRSFHSSGVKFDLSAIDSTPLLNPLFSSPSEARSLSDERRELSFVHGTLAAVADCSGRRRRRPRRVASIAPALPR